MMSYTITTTWDISEDIHAKSIVEACQIAISMFGENIGMIVHDNYNDKSHKYLGN